MQHWGTHYKGNLSAPEDLHSFCPKLIYRKPPNKSQFAESLRGPWHSICEDPAPALIQLRPQTQPNWQQRNPQPQLWRTRPQNRSLKCTISGVLRAAFVQTCSETGSQACNALGCSCPKWGKLQFRKRQRAKRRKRHKFCWPCDLTASS